MATKKKTEKTLTLAQIEEMAAKLCCEKTWESAPETTKEQWRNAVKKTHAHFVATGVIK